MVNILRIFPAQNRVVKGEESRKEKMKHSFIVAGVEGEERQRVNLLEGDFESIKITWSWTSCINLGVIFP